MRTLLVIAITGLGGCAVNLPQRVALSPTGPLVTEAATIKAVPENPLHAPLFVGDTIEALDDTPIHSLADGMQALSQRWPAKATVKHLDGTIVTMPFSAIATESPRHFNVTFLPDGEVMTTQTTSLSGLPAKAGLVYPGRIAGSVILAKWATSPNMLEVEVALSVPNDCSDCALRDISIMDWGRRAWLSAVPLQTAAYALLPDQGAPLSPVAVPPPTVVGSNSYTTMNGTVNASTYGGYTTGRVNGTAYTTTTPVYDYSAQSEANGQNLGIAIRNAQIENTNKARMQFATSRMGNLRAGPLNSGEKVTGHLFFAVPPGFPGPYVVFVDAGQNAVSAVRFEMH